jgi:hypothetical protein
VHERLNCVCKSVFTCFLKTVHIFKTFLYGCGGSFLEVFFIFYFLSILCFEKCFQKLNLNSIFNEDCI